MPAGSIVSNSPFKDEALGGASPSSQKIRSTTTDSIGLPTSSIEENPLACREVSVEAIEKDKLKKTINELAARLEKLEKLVEGNHKLAKPPEVKQGLKEANSKPWKEKLETVLRIIVAVVSIVTTVVVCISTFGAAVPAMLPIIMAIAAIIATVCNNANLIVDLIRSRKERIGI